MSRNLRPPRMCFVLPELFPSAQVKAMHHPMMNPLGWGPHPLTLIKTFFRLNVSVIGDDRGDEHAVAPNDRA
jgi:hypothetical protein